jgi:P-type E1-E2 ATPase
MTGEARAIVVCVGENTLLARSRKRDKLIIKEEMTDLENKLDKISISVGKIAEVAMWVCLISQFVYLLFFVGFTTGEYFSNDTCLRMIQIFIIAICILIVAIPEGLPLAVSVAMALSISKMKKDNILIKNVEAVQKCASLHDICVSKTGTITEGEMHVGAY